MFLNLVLLVLVAGSGAQDNSLEAPTKGSCMGPGNQRVSVPATNTDNDKVSQPIFGKG